MTAATYRTAVNLHTAYSLGESSSQVKRKSQWLDKPLLMSSSMLSLSSLPPSSSSSPPSPLPPRSSSASPPSSQSPSPPEPPPQPQAKLPDDVVSYRDMYSPSPPSSPQPSTPSSPQPSAPSSPHPSVPSSPPSSPPPSPPPSPPSSPSPSPPSSPPPSPPLAPPPSPPLVPPPSPPSLPSPDRTQLTPVLRTDTQFVTLLEGRSCFEKLPSADTHRSKSADDEGNFNCYREDIRTSATEANYREPTEIEVKASADECGVVEIVEIQRLSQLEMKLFQSNHRSLNVKSLPNTTEYLQHPLFSYVPDHRPPLPVKSNKSRIKLGDHLVTSTPPPLPDKLCRTGSLSRKANALSKRHPPLRSTKKNSATTELSILPSLSGESAFVRTAVNSPCSSHSSSLSSDSPSPVDYENHGSRFLAKQILHSPDVLIPSDSSTRVNNSVTILSIPICKVKRSFRLKNMETDELLSLSHKIANVSFNTASNAIDDQGFNDSDLSTNKTFSQYRGTPSRSLPARKKKKEPPGLLFLLSRFQRSHTFHSGTSITSKVTAESGFSKASTREMEDCSLETSDKNSMNQLLKKSAPRILKSPKFNFNTKSVNKLDVVNYSRIASRPTGGVVSVNTGKPPRSDRFASRTTRDTQMSFRTPCSEETQRRERRQFTENRVYEGECANDEPPFRYVDESGQQLSQGGIGTPSVPHTPAAAITPQQLKESILLLQNGLESGALVSKFETLYRRKPGLTMDVARLGRNENRNRYRDISPYDATRVILQDVTIASTPTTTTTTSASSAAFNDYINASHVIMEIPGSNITNRYIASQGPLHSTCGQFWQMVWEQHCNILVMLTTCIEQGRSKCHQYWPDANNSTDYGPVSVSCDQIDTKPGFSVRELSVTNRQSGEKRRITHLQYLAWPDHGVPEQSTDFLSFVKEVRQLRACEESFSSCSVGNQVDLGTTRPTLVHCSAGIGRTGVLILMETAQCLIEAQQPVYPVELVQRMRDQRAMMIQTSGQFRFVCEAINRVYSEKLVQPLPQYCNR